MVAWRVARSLEKLREQVNLVAPDRNKTNGPDGTIGDASHQSRDSDHNPHIKDSPGPNVVSALDLTHDPQGGFNAYTFGDWLRLHPDIRAKYVIVNRQIWNPSISKEWRPYNGANPHDKHVHISVLPTKTLYDSVAPWDIGPMKVDPDAPILPDKPVLRKGMKGEDVRYLQTLLSIKADGNFGPVTDKAVQAFQKSLGLVADGVVGGYTWGELLKGPQDNSWQTNIVATVFGGTSEVERSAYDNHRILENELVVALPYRFKGERPTLTVKNIANGKTATATVEDVGPWLTDDPYWERGMRPLAEKPGPIERGPNKGRTSNKAGIDLSPGLARALGISGRGVVDWRIV